MLRIANGSACRADPCDRLKRNAINYVRDGRGYSLQAQGDFRGIAFLQYLNIEYAFSGMLDRYRPSSVTGSAAFPVPSYPVGHSRTIPQTI